MNKVLLCIMDGVGIKEDSFGNAFFNAKTPNYDFLWNNYPHSLLKASGEMVGLPKGQMGNSEVGHSNIGAGRIVYQSLEYINKSIYDKSFFSNEKFLKIIEHCKKNNSKLHLMGLLSDGGVHSHIEHLFSLLELLKENDFNNVYIHAFLDGRDTTPKSAVKYLELLDKKMKELDIGNLATVSGRFYAMDRDNNFDRISLAYDAITLGKGKKYKDYKEALADQYGSDITDEFIIPSVVNENGMVNDNDGIILFNFREDRVVELFSALTNKKYEKNIMIKRNNLAFVSMMHIGKTIVGDYAFRLPKIENTLGEVVSNRKMTQLRIAETEKYYHVTFFFDGMQDTKFKGCKKVLIPSPKVKTYDLCPEMSANKTTSTLLEEVKNNYPDLIILNFANGDMVGHTGNYDAAVKGVETVDKCLGQIYNDLNDKYIIVVTADHGNCETMLNEDNTINTAHTTNMVPFIITDKSVKLVDGKLGDISPTILELLKVEKPKEMTGVSLIRK